MMTADDVMTMLFGLARRDAENIRAGRTIKTHCLCPPIPVRQFDFAAWFDDVGPEAMQGYGATEIEAIADLKRQDWEASEENSADELQEMRG